MGKEKLIEVTIDGSVVQVAPGTTILEAASQADIEIPTLCHHAELSPSGSCRMCIVEISRPERDPNVSWIDAACVAPVASGFHVKTDSPKVIKERKLIVGLLLSRAPTASRIVELAEEYGVPSDRFVASDEGKANCILCGLCVRVCNELIGANAIGTAKRGIEKEITSPFKVAASLCIGCMACVKVCPTGVIEFQVNKGKIKKEDWGVSLKMLTCSECGQPVGAGAQMKQIKGDVDVSKEVLALCPACRRKRINSVKTAQTQYTGV